MKNIFLSSSRGMDQLEAYLPGDFLIQGAETCTKNSSRVLITSGFFILASQAFETDGPPGVAALGRALSRLGSQVALVSDKAFLPFWENLPWDFSWSFIGFPQLSRPQSLQKARKILEDFQPTLLISIERCGPTKEGKYQNMKGIDISSHTAKIDTIFDLSPIPSLAIGDGGNEIGMGNLAEPISRLLKITPCVTPVNHLILAEVSNWGAYGLVRTMEKLLGRQDLLWNADDERDFVEQMVSLGAVDGVSGRSEPTVDGFSQEKNRQVLQDIRAF